MTAGFISSFLSVPLAVANSVHIAHGSGARQGFHASGVKGQRLLKPVAVSGLRIVMDGFRPHAQWL